MLIYVCAGGAAVAGGCAAQRGRVQGRRRGKVPYSFRFSMMPAAFLVMS